MYGSVRGMRRCRLTLLDVTGRPSIDSVEGPALTLSSIQLLRFSVKLLSDSQIT